MDSKLKTVLSLQNNYKDELAVSLPALPAYIEDEEIMGRLMMWGVSAISPIKKRMWTGAQFVKVKFTKTVKSLPYSVRFETLQGIEHFRVIHNRQVKVCRNCIQPGHILKRLP